MAQKFVLLEKVIRRAPLGMRFRDVLRGGEMRVNDGLLVMAWPKDNAQAVYQVEKGIQAARSPMSGNYGYHELPGLYAYQVGKDDNPDPLDFVVYVEDRYQRFLPQVLLLALPRERPLDVQLYSSPTRPRPAGLGLMYGQLWHPLTDTPAAWAVIQATWDAEHVYQAIADERGMFNLFFTYPPPPQQDNGSLDKLKLDALEWPFTIEVFFQPDAPQIEIIGPPPDMKTTRLPDMKTILNQYDDQNTKRIRVFDTFNTSKFQLSRVVHYETDLLLQTDGITVENVGEDEYKRLRSRLLVDPA